MLGPDVYGDASSGVEACLDLAPTRGEGGHEVVEKKVGKVFVKYALVAKGPEVELKGLGFHDAFVGNIADMDLSEVRLARDGA